MNAAVAGLSGELVWRALEAGDLDAIYALHRAAIGEAVRPEIVKPESRDFFAGILAGRGRMIGVFLDDVLIAYGVLQHALPDYDDPRPHLGLAADAPIAKLAGASVAQLYRGRSLQRALIAARVAMAPESHILFATSAPANTPSWTNLLAEGFAVRALRPYYGGHLRYVMVRDGTRVVPRAERLVVPADAGTQSALLAAGWRGVEARSVKGEPHILYVSEHADA